MHTCHHLLPYMSAVRLITLFIFCYYYNYIYSLHILVAGQIQEIYVYLSSPTEGRKVQEVGIFITDLLNLCMVLYNGYAMLTLHSVHEDGWQPGDKEQEDIVCQT